MTMVERFEQLFGRRPSGVWAAPGRVNLIGDHTDYNGGFVLPFALQQRAQVAVRPRTDGVLRCASLQEGGAVVATTVGSLVPKRCSSWSAYVVGVAWALAERGVRVGVGGFDLLLDSDVPVGAGLASSAAVETATASALSELLGEPLPPMELALLCHRAESAFVGAPVGVMDQVVSAGATAGHALLLDCRSLEVQHVPFDTAALGCRLLVVDTRAQHANNDGAYAELRAACEGAAAGLGLDALRDATAEQVAEHAQARHVVSECARVLAAVEALHSGDAVRLGALMLESHVSLRDDFEVSSPELDVAVDAAVTAGALGARLTGAGLGGCAIALVPEPLVSQVTAAVGDAFAAQCFAQPVVFPVTAGAGAGRVG